MEELVVAARTHSAVVARALRSQQRVARTISIVVRFDDFTGVTRSQTLSFGIDDEFAITAIAEALLASIELAHSVRLLGVHASSFIERSENQMQLTFGFEATSQNARELRESGMEIETQRGRHAFGPEVTP